VIRRPAESSDPAAEAARGALRLTRGISTTWWYTLIATVCFEVLLVTLWGATLAEAGASVGTLATVGIGGLLWAAATLPLLLDYRHRLATSGMGRWQRMAVPLAVAVVYGLVAGIAAHSWIVATLPLAQAVVMLNWPQGVRVRVVVLITALIAGAWIIDARVTFGAGGAYGSDIDWLLMGLYSALLPAMTAVSLWWWDVLDTLDHARLSEARLAATQERLRVATDVHDLQGHHLQVIALQLELAERLMDRDPEAALGQLKAARASVDDARQGTRELAAGIRTVPLRDELANAVDLLRAAGAHAEVVIDDDADRAPAAVLGPVIRETTTNVLRHGGGDWARLALTRIADGWRYEIANDLPVDAVTGDDQGAGLDGLHRRADDAGGTLDVRRGSDDFTLVMTVPDAGGRR
jgi:two-component system sensor histidine kinase DesK